MHAVYKSQLFLFTALISPTISLSLHQKVFSAVLFFVFDFVFVIVFVISASLPISLKVFIAVQLSLPYITRCTVFVNNLINNNTFVLIIAITIATLTITIIVIVSEIAGPAFSSVVKSSSTNNLQKCQSVLSQLYMCHSHDQNMIKNRLIQQETCLI